jgi:hypothetical protein
MIVKTTGSTAIRMAMNNGGRIPWIMPRTTGGSSPKNGSTLIKVFKLAILDTAITGIDQKMASAVAAETEIKERTFLAVGLRFMLSHTTSKGEISTYIGAILKGVG